MARRRLPAVPNLEHLKHQAKRFLDAYRDGANEAVADFEAYHPHAVGPQDARLTDAQLALARTYGQPSWPRLVATVELRRALHGDDLEALRRTVAEHGAALGESVAPRSGLTETTLVKERNAKAFLRTFAAEIAWEDLDVLPRRWGDSVVFAYGASKFLKVPKNGHREHLLRETRLYDHLNGQGLPFICPEALFVHPQGLYAVLARVEGRQLTPQVLEGLAPAEVNAAATAIARFFTGLHRHRFPEQILAGIPRCDDPYDVHVRRARRKAAFVGEHGDGDEAGVAAAWKARLDALEPHLQQRWGVTHTDPQTAHFFLRPGEPPSLSVLDLAGVLQHDPAIDLAEFAVEATSRLSAGRARDLLDGVLARYDTDDPAIREKVEYGLLEFEIRRACQRVRVRLRETEGSTA